MLRLTNISNGDMEKEKGWLSVENTTRSGAEDMWGIKQRGAGIDDGVWGGGNIRCSLGNSMTPQRL